MHAVFNEIVAWDDGTPEYGIVDSGKESVIEFIREGTVTPVPVSFSSVYTLERPRIAFYDYYRKTIGVFNLAEKKLVWTRLSSQNRSEHLFTGVLPGRNRVIYQVRDRIAFLDADTGECDQTKLIEGSVVGIGVEWLVLENEGTCIVSCGKKKVAFSRKNDIGFVREFGNFLVFVERQGPARVVSIPDCELLFEVLPDRNSQFSQAFMCENGRLFLTLHYFDQPKTTYSYYFDSLASKTPEIVSIPTSGQYIFANQGRELVYFHRKIFSSETGDQLENY